MRANPKGLSPKEEKEGEDQEEVQVPRSERVPKKEQKEPTGKVETGRDQGTQDQVNVEIPYAETFLRVYRRRHELKIEEV